jgi:hypothetical protein
VNQSAGRNARLEAIRAENSRRAEIARQKFADEVQALLPPGWRAEETSVGMLLRNEHGAEGHIHRWGAEWHTTAYEQGNKKEFAERKFATIADAIGWLKQPRASVIRRENIKLYATMGSGLLLALLFLGGTAAGFVLTFTGNVKLGSLILTALSILYVLGTGKPFLRF